MDPLMLAVEVYNPNKFNIEFRRRPDFDRYVLENGKNPGPAKIYCMADGFCILPHRYYTGHGIGLPDHEPVNVLLNEGPDMGKGIKRPGGGGIR
jgi:hypothetical protein